MERVDFDLEEYRALRAEIIQSMDDGNQIMSFGLAAVGLVLGAGIAAKDTVFGFFIMAFFLPVMAALVLSFWFAAQERIARASHYLSGAEVRIKSAFLGESSVSWEAWLRLKTSKRRSEHFWSTEQSGIALFLLIILSSVVISQPVGGSSVVLRLRILTLAATLIVSGTVMFQIRRRFRNWKRWLSTQYDPSAWDASGKLST